jgi:protein phosphatase
VITRAVGTDPDIDVDRFTVEAQPGDVYLICSDGLTDMLDEGQIRDVFAQHPNDLQGAAKALVSAANRVGGDDNITVVVFEIGGETSSADTQAMDLPTKENALADEDTLSGLEAPVAAEAPRGHGRLLWAVVLVALGALGLLLWLLVR